jgi:hypothetical protein
MAGKACPFRLAGVHPKIPVLTDQGVSGAVECIDHNCAAWNPDSSNCAFFFPAQLPSILRNLDKLGPSPTLEDDLLQDCP